MRYEEVVGGLCYHESNGPECTCLSHHSLSASEGPRLLGVAFAVAQRISVIFTVLVMPSVLAFETNGHIGMQS